MLLIRHGESENNELSAISRNEYITKRKADPALTERGHEQAGRVGEFLEEVRKIESLPGEGNLPGEGKGLWGDLSTVYVSPMRRTLQTAAAINKALRRDVPFMVAPKCFEIGGAYTGHKEDANTGTESATGGLTMAEIGEEFPFVSSSGVGGLSSSFLGGWFETFELKETVEEAVSRIGKVVEACACLDEGAGGENRKTIAIVCHGDFIDFFLRIAVLKEDAEHIATNRDTIFKSFNCQICGVEFFGGEDSRGARKCRLLFHNHFGHLLGAVELGKLGTV